MATTGTARSVALGGVGIGLFGIGLSALLNLRGLIDGVSASGPALGAAVAISAGYGLVILWWLVRARRRSVD